MYLCTHCSILLASCAAEKMVFSSYKKQRILFYYFQGYRPPTTVKLLQEERLTSSRQGVLKFLKQHLASGCIARAPGSGRPSKATEEIKAFVEAQMRIDDETTAYQLHNLLKNRGFDISMRTILRCRTALGWTFRGSSYCQLIRVANKEKRLAWAQQHLTDTFETVVWTDECTVQLESHHRFCCRKRGEPPRNAGFSFKNARVHYYYTYYSQLTPISCPLLSIEFYLQQTI